MKTVFNIPMLLVILLLFMPATGGAQRNQERYFEHLSLKDGLPHTSTYDILQDHLGLMWFATEEGLAKYDGYEFTVYKHDPTDPNSLSDSAVYALHQDRKHALWLITPNGGINRFDPATEIFVHYQYDEDDRHSVSSNAFFFCNIYEDPQGVLWFGTADAGVNRFEPDTEQFRVFRHDNNDPESLSHDTIYVIQPDPSGKWLWIGTQEGLNKFDPATGKMIRYVHDPHHSDSLSHNTIRTIYHPAGGDVLWVGTDYGLNRLDLRDGSIRRYVNHPENPASLGHNFIRKIYPADDGKLWIGTGGGGLNLFDPVSERFDRNLADVNSPMALSDNSIWSLFEDKTGILWIGTALGGVNILNPQRKKFRLYQHHPYNPNSLTVSDVFGLHVDRRGHVWVGTVGGGLNKFDPVTGQFTRYQHDESNPYSLSHNFVHPIFEDRHGVLWAGTWGGGLNKFDPQSEQFHHYRNDPNDPNSLSGDRVRAIAEDGQGNLWIGTTRNGLNKFDRENEKFIQYRYRPDDAGGLISDNIWNIFKDSRGILWISTGHGLESFDPETETFVHYHHENGNPNSLSDNVVSNIYEDAEGIFWLATRLGLNRYDPLRREFRHYFEKDGLPHNRVQSILGDDRGFLWISTARGLARFDPQHETFKTYHASDGLQGEFFRAWAYARHPNGELYFGGSNGLNRFDPADITENPYPPPVVLIDFLLFNESSPIGDGTVLPKHISELETLALNYEHSAFSIEFAALNYSSPDENRYAYKMEGFDRDWIYTDAGRRLATYTNLAPGRYTFRVKASNNDGVWNEEGRSLAILIAPPWWRTNLFRGSVIFIALGSLSGIFFWQHGIARRRERKLEKKVALRTRQLAEAKDAAEAANRAKSTFLANMSHELRTPLNAILGFAQVLTHNPALSEKELEALGIIQQGGEHLLTLINQVLDLSKVEAGHITLNAKNIDLHRLLDDLRIMFSLKVQKKGISFEIERTDDLPRWICSDEVKLRQVLINLINNAIKFTDEGEVRLSVNSALRPVFSRQRSVVSEESWDITDHCLLNTEDCQPTAQYRLQFTVKDTGAGIAPEEIGHVFEAFKQTERGRYSQEGTGLGLPISRKFVQLMGGDIDVKSSVGQGTVFTFHILAGLVERPAAEVQCLTLRKRAIGLEPGQPCFRILIVDDEPFNRKLLLTLLHPFGFELREAENGRKAVEIWNEWQPHLIWMDIRMPVSDGYDATQSIREAEEKSNPTRSRKRTIIIALSASVFEEELSTALSKGCDDFLRKPFREAEMLELLHEHLGVRFIDEEDTKLCKTDERQGATLDASAFAGLPEELVIALEEALVKSDMADIAELIDDVRLHSPNLADVIAELANNFEYPELLTALRQSRAAALSPDTASVEELAAPEQKRAADDGEQ